MTTERATNSAQVKARDILYRIQQLGSDLLRRLDWRKLQQVHACCAGG